MIRQLCWLGLLAALVVPVTTTARQSATRLGVAGQSNATPWIDAKGSTVAIAWGATPPGGKTDVFVAISRDAGATFGPPVRVNAIEGEARLGGELPPRVAVIPSSRPGGDPNVVVVYGAKNATTEIKMARSTDGGRTFGIPGPLSLPTAAGDRGWHAMTVDAQGRPQVMWLDHRAMAARKGEEHKHDEAAAMDGAKMAQLSSLYFAGNLAIGDPDVPKERELATGVCYCCKVAMAASPTGPGVPTARTVRGGVVLYAAWRHVYAGNIRDIAFTFSHDDGRTFSEPARVSRDEWQLAGCPDDGPAMTVDAQGVVHLVWPTVIGGDQPQGAIFYASSRDGKTFTARQRVPTLGSPRPMHPQIAATGPGLIVAWDEVIGGVRQAAWRSLTVDAEVRATFGAEQRLGATGTPSSYPMVASTSRGPLVLWVDGAPGASTIAIALLR